LVIKEIKVKEENPCNIIISNAEAMKIKSILELLRLFDRCCVVI